MDISFLQLPSHIYPKCCNSVSLSVLNVKTVKTVIFHVGSSILLDFFGMLLGGFFNDQLLFTARINSNDDMYIHPRIHLPFLQALS